MIAVSRTFSNAAPSAEIATANMFALPSAVVKCSANFPPLAAASDIPLAASLVVFLILARVSFCL